MTNIWSKIGAIGGIIAGVGVQIAPIVPAKWIPIVSSIATIGGTLAALWHPAPGTTATDQPKP